MNANIFVVAFAGLLLVACGGEAPADDAAAPAATGTETAAAPTDAAPTDVAAPAASGTASAAPVTQGESATYAPGELLPGGAVDVLQREGFRPPA